MPKRLPKFVYEDTDRHGNIRAYYRRRGQPKVRLLGSPWSAGFMEQYEKALSASSHKQAEALGHRGKPNTWRWLCQSYFGSVEFKQLSARTQLVRRRILETTFEEPISPSSEELFADFPIQRMTRKAIKVLRDRKSETPEAANARLKAIRRVFAYGLEEHDKVVTINPARDVPFFASSIGGYHTWTKEEVETYLSKHPVGSKARLALYLLLYTGARRSDVIQLGPQMVRDGWLRFQPRKTRHTSAEFVEIPVLPKLADLLPDPARARNLNYLVTDFGKPYSPDGFGNRFRAWCKQAGLSHCSAHGLRKAGATFAAENGATEHQLMAIYGWKSAKMAALYTRKARQKKMAGAAMSYISLGSADER